MSGAPRLRTSTRSPATPAADALRAALDAADARGLGGMDEETLVAIPAIVQETTSELAAARSTGLDEGLVGYLEALLSRAWARLIPRRRRQGRALLELLFLRIPYAIYELRTGLAVAVALVVLGAVLGGQLDSELATIAEYLPPKLLQTVSMLREPAEGAVLIALTSAGAEGMLAGPYSQIFLLFFAFQVLAFLGIYTFGFWTPVLLVGSGSLLGVMFTATAPALRMEFFALLAPLLLPSLTAMCFSGAAGLHMVGALFPSAMENRRAELAWAGQRALLVAAAALAVTLSMSVGVYLHATAAPGPGGGMAIGLTLFFFWWGYALLLGAVQHWRLRTGRSAPAIEDAPYTRPLLPVLERETRVPTAFGPPARVRIASLYARGLAVVFDMWTMSVGLYVLALLVLLTPLSEERAIPILALLAILVLTLYFVVFELFWRGQTPGKALLGIRVVRLDGAPLDVRSAVLRNLSRPLEGALAAPAVALIFLQLRELWIAALVSGLAAILVGGLFPFFSRRNQRVGDFVAGTTVVSLPASAQPSTQPEVNAQDGERLAPAHILRQYGSYELNVIDVLLREGETLDFSGVEAAVAHITGGVERPTGEAAQRWLSRFYAELRADIEDGARTRDTLVR